MKSFGVIALAASASAAYINGTVPMNGTVYTTEVVTALTTVCPAPTSGGVYTTTIANNVYTVKSATTITVTNCPCTLTKPATSMATGGSATSSMPAIYTGAAGANVVAAGYGLAAFGAAVAFL
ncbi:hypothetical protein M436DRAFT_77765 [Aureobasidium namibiae CBS 147.97]|uniref:Clock-controlled protein 6 n=1 Tax=Aureobasidium namibiae CBS 147.97 TaxID=1043004 RepID=A0A074WXI4_9PEZI